MLIFGSKLSIKFHISGVELMQISVYLYHAYGVVSINAVITVPRSES